MKLHQNPKLFEFDDTEGIVDVFVKKDPYCPYPFTNTNTKSDIERWWHQGFYLRSFILYLKDFFERNNLPYKIMEISDRKKEPFYEGYDPKDVDVDYSMEKKESYDYTKPRYLVKKKTEKKERLPSEQKVMCSDCNDTVFSKKEDGSITCDARCKEDSGDEKEFSLEQLNKFADEQISQQESHYYHKPTLKPPEPKYLPIPSLCNDYDECSLCPEDPKVCDLNKPRENPTLGDGIPIDARFPTTDKDDKK